MLNNRANILQLSQDGSHTVLSGIYDTTYHSTHGAIQESRHVFLESGLAYWKSLNPHKGACTILEMGMGTGLNVLMTLDACIKMKLSVLYTSIEKYPIEAIIYEQLNYARLLKIDQRYLNKIHDSPWDTQISMHSDFQLKKVKDDFLKIDESNEADIIFYDAFGPGTQANLWDLNAAKKIYSLMQNGGIFVTYCAQGAFRRNLESTGLCVEKIPGPPGKREMIRATKK